MTDIEQAARAETEREYPLPADLSTTSRTLRLVAREHYANGFQAGAAWLSDFLLSEESIEKVARVLLTDYQMQYDGGRLDEFTDLARAALSAVLRKGAA